MKLGKLKELDIRKVFPHEQYDFSSWLAKEDNINELGDTLGLSLTDIETEKFVGNYRCDILCKDELTGKTVLIENQLEPTNHDHLGKIITYASGLDAAVIVWIVSSARAEHSSAVEWLNKHTDDEVSFFLIEVHAYTIGDSEPAPQFRIIEKPNDFSRIVKEAKKNDFTETENNRLEFWTKLNDYVEQNGKLFNTHKPSTDSWYGVATGSSKCCISIDLVNKSHKIRVSVWIYDNKDLFDYFFENKDNIEEVLDLSLQWERLDNKKASRVSKEIDGLDFNKKDNYQELIQRTVDYVIKMKNAFKPYI